MKRLVSLTWLWLLVIPALIAQSGYVKEVKEKNEDEVIKASLTSLNKDYNYRNPTSSVYDTLIYNVSDFRSDEVPKYTDAIYAQRLGDIPSLIRMDYNVYVRRYIDLYTLERREQVSRMLGLSRAYFPIFEEALDREGMPMELKYLPIVESALNPHARSWVGATGLWQFMFSTGRMYGLRVNSFVDERSNPYKSTDAAIRYLKNAYDEFGDWQLAIASYNCGAGNVRKAIARSGGKRNFWAIRRYLPRETRGYVPAFIAATYVFNYAHLHNLYPVYVNFDFNVDTLHIRNMDITLKDIAAETNTQMEVLKNLNPELKRGRIPYTSKTYILRVPSRVSTYFAAYPTTVRDKYGKRSNVAATYDKDKAYSSTSAFQPTYTAPKGNGKLHYHTVKSGEVVGAIAEAYGVSARNISYWNNLRRYRIRVGQKLKIYTNKTPKPVVVASSQPAKATATVASAAPAPSANGTYYAVRRGDTIWSIARKHPGTTTQSIMSLNKGINANDLKVGQKIRVK